MAKDNDKIKYMRNSLTKEGVSVQSANFFIFFVELFPGSNPGSVPMISTTNKLAEDFGKSERTIRRYVTELKKAFSYIRVQPHYNNDNPDKSYIEYNIYHLLKDSVDLIEKAEAFMMRYENVYFERKQLTS